MSFPNSFLKCPHYVFRDGFCDVRWNPHMGVQLMDGIHHVGELADSLVKISDLNAHGGVVLISDDAIADHEEQDSHAVTLRGHEMDPVGPFFMDGTEEGNAFRYLVHFTRLVFEASEFDDQPLLVLKAALQGIGQRHESCHSGTNAT